MTLRRRKPREGSFWVRGLANMPACVYAIIVMKVPVFLFALTVLLFTAERSRADATVLSVMESTFKLFNKDSTATCFLLHGKGAPGRVYLVTAAHVLEKATGEEALLVLRDARPDGTYVRRDVPLEIREGEKSLWTKHGEEDVAVLPLDLPGAELPSLSVEVLAREEDLRKEGITVCSRAWMLGYPARMEANGAGFPIARNVSIASFPLAPVEPHRTFMADGSTFAGDSGGPVFAARARGKSAGKPMILGMMVAQYRNDEKVRTLHEERLIRHRLSLGKVVQAEFIRQTVAAVK